MLFLDQLISWFKAEKNKRKNYMAIGHLILMARNKWTVDIGDVFIKSRLTALSLTALQ
jgi:hypothetical protein